MSSVFKAVLHTAVGSLTKLAAIMHVLYVALDALSSFLISRMPWKAVNVPLPAVLILIVPGCGAGLASAITSESTEHVTSAVVHAADAGSSTAALHSRPSVTGALMVILLSPVRPDITISEEVPIKLNANWLDISAVVLAGFAALIGEIAAP